MTINSSDVTWVEEPPMNFWEATFLPAIFQGLSVTASHIDGHTVTEQYPEQKPTLPLNYRGVHRLNRDEAGRVKCVACMMCATACPARCISIDAAEAPKTDPLWDGRDKYPASFVLDELKCIYCGMCEEACPCDAIELTHIYDLTGFTREEMLFDKQKLLSVYDQTKDSGLDPVRTHRGRLSGTSEFTSLPPLGPATAVNPDDRAAKGISSGVISR
ncbi:MAG TPA: NADH-quinone oxidoreductase subunit I [Planctomycetaceae bacterium]|nr:NADH-quinone oxidoreductase subunit I [Planctomycetaceae bacterium]